MKFATLLVSTALLLGCSPMHKTLRLETRDVRPVQCLRIEITPGRFNLPAPQAYVQAVRNVLDTQATTEFLQRNGIRHCTPQRDAPDLASHTLFLPRESGQARIE